MDDYSSKSDVESSLIPTSPLRNQHINYFTKSPYYLHPAENLGSALISPQLNKTN